VRVIFLFFLLVNAVYFYTQSDLFKPQTGPVILKQQDLPKGVERLRLLRERGLGTSSAKTSRKTAELDKTPKVLQKAAKPVPVSKKQAVKKESVDKPAVINVTKAKVAPKPAKSKPEKSSKPVCFTLGPFGTTATANHADEAISALGVAVKQRRTEQRRPRGYWVYLPSFKTYEAARRQVNLLQKKGLKDLFIMGKGEHKNAVSLGLFKREGAAEERYQLVEKMGLSVKKETQYRVRNLVWLDMIVPGDKTKTVASLTEVADKYSRTNLSQHKCE
jgi:hypothetical protein